MSSKGSKNGKAPATDVGESKKLFNAMATATAEEKALLPKLRSSVEEAVLL